MAMASGIRAGTLPCPSFPSQKTCFLPFKASVSLKPKASSQDSSTILCLKKRTISRIQKLQASATTEAVEAETSYPAPTSQESEPSQETAVAEKLKKKRAEKPRLVLKFIWMEKNIGLGLDQVIQGHGTVPLSPYFFWPRKDAWEELKTTLESKPWISQKKMIILLNQATDIINLWQQSGGNLSQ